MTQENIASSERLYGYKFNINNTISMIIMGSDKCRNNERHKKHFNKGIEGEMYCLHYNNYMKIAEIIHVLVPNVDTIVVTSEDKHVIDGFKE